MHLIYAFNRTAKLFITRSHISWEIAFTKVDITVFNSCKLLGRSLKTLSLALPHRKKSTGLRSGEWGAHGFSVLFEITRSSNMSWSASNV